jgi:hypothetical protein
MREPRPPRRSRSFDPTAVARVHTRFEALLVGHALKQLHERLALSIVQSGGELIFGREPHGSPG